MGCSQNHGPLLVIDYIAAPILGVPKWDSNFGNCPYVIWVRLACFRCRASVHDPPAWCCPTCTFLSGDVGFGD